MADYGLCQARGKPYKGDKMKLSYKKLWVKLVELDMKKTEFAKKAGISSASVAKLGKGANITTDVLVKICEISILLSFFALQAYSYCILYHLYSLMSSKLLYIFKLITLNS